MASKSTSRKRSKKQSPGAEELMLSELQEIHSAENQLTRNLPRMAKAVQTDRLREMIELRLEQGERLIDEIDGIFDEMESSPGRKRNVAAEGLVNDAREHLQEIEHGPALDAVMIGALQKTEHYCIAAWGTAKALGEALSRNNVVQCMERALGEGRDLDQRLTEIAEEDITPSLMSGEDDGEYEMDDEESSSARTRSGTHRGDRRHSARH